jgi:hypothetical protein
MEASGQHTNHGIVWHHTGLLIFSFITTFMHDFCIRWASHWCMELHGQHTQHGMVGLRPGILFFIVVFPKSMHDLFL